MHRTAKAVLAAGSVLLLCGYALGQDVRLPRKGSSPGFEMRPLEHGHPPRFPRHGHHPGPPPWERRERPAPPRPGAHCWKAAQEAQLAQERAKQNAVVGYVVGGLIGALIGSSQDKDVFKDPQTVRREAYDKCMGRQRRTDDDDDDDKEDDDN